MTVHELAPGLWRWTAPHPNWKPGKGGPGGWEQHVGCVYYEAADAVVLIEPQLPPAGSEDCERFWRALDRDIERTARPIAILIGNCYHGRSTDEVVARYRGRRDISVHVHVDGRPRTSCTATSTFEDGAVLPGGVQAHAIAGFDVGETAFWIAEHRALVFADAVLGAGDGSVTLAPRSWAPDGQAAAELYANEFRPSIERLADLDPLWLIPSHGNPVLDGGAEALRRAASGDRSIYRD